MADLDFVRRCVEGDRRAWDEFIEKYSRLIYNYIHSVLKIKSSYRFSQSDLDDLFQDIFLLLSKGGFQKLKTFKAKNGCSLASWLRQVVVNHTIDYLRRFKPLVSLDAETDDGFSLKDVLADDAAPAADALAAEERIAQLKDCIKGLDTEDKYFLELHLNRGLAPKELRKVLKVSRGAVDMRKSRLIERLRDCFRGKGFALDF